LSTSGSSDFDLRALLRILRRRLWVLIVVPTLVGGVAVASANLETPMYRSSADILIARTQAEIAFNIQGGLAVSDPNRLMANQIRVIRSQALTGLVRERLGFGADIAAVASKTEDVISLSAVDADPERAASIVDAYADAYLNYRRSTSASQNATIQSELQRQIDSAEAQLKSLDDAIAIFAPDQREAARATQADQRNVLVTNLATQRARLSQLESAANVEEGGAQLLAPADVPGSPFEPHPVRSGLLGLAVGLMLAVGLLLLVDYLDNKIRGKEDLERCADGIPVIGLIPTQAGWRKPGLGRVVSIDAPTSSSSEAYRSLRTAIQFLGVERSFQTLQVTSPAGSDGKTTTLVNLAVSLARAGQRVVVVDCDLRRPRVHQFLGVDAEPGFTSVLVGKVDLAAALRKVPGVPGLAVLPAGPIPPNPSELLAGRKTVAVLTALQAGADIVLVDSPPLLPVADAAVVARLVDCTLMVVKAGSTHRKEMTRALELLRQVNAEVVGTLLNHAPEEEQYGYGGYGYRPFAPPKVARRQRRKAAKAAEALAKAAKVSRRQRRKAIDAGEVLAQAAKVSRRQRRRAAKAAEALAKAAKVSRRQRRKAIDAAEVLGEAANVSRRQRRKAVDAGEVLGEAAEAPAEPARQSSSTAG
jgi:polysaccharide biosynthesis transport protein